MKGIILAGGSGTRLHPLTLALSKQLLPVHDKPMIYYPLSTLMLAGVRDILLISTPHDIGNFERLLGDGSGFGINLTYAVQESPDGLPQAFLIGEEHIRGESSMLVLGDNLFVGAGLGRNLASIATSDGATIFGYWMQDPTAYGVVEFGADGKARTLEEKPTRPKSNYAIPGLYLFDHRVSEFAGKLEPSARGELEMVDLHQQYLERGELDVQVLPRGSTWLDMGTADTLADAGEYVRTLQRRQGLLIHSPEEVAWSQGWISDEGLLSRASSLGKSTYAQRLRDVVARSESLS